MDTLNDHIKQLEKHKAKLQYELKSIQISDRIKNRKSDNRKKILVGAAILNQVENKKFDQEQLKKILDGFLTRPKERALFNLTPKKNSDSGGQLSLFKNLCESIIVYRCGAVDQDDFAACKHYKADAKSGECEHAVRKGPGILACTSKKAGLEAAKVGKAG